MAVGVVLMKKEPSRVPSREKETVHKKFAETFFL